MNHMLVVGASGVIGSALVDAAGQRPDWQVYAMSRRAPDLDPPAAFQHVPVDLTDEAAAARALGPLRDRLTHIVYAAVAEKPGLAAGWVDDATMQLNRRMLHNVLAPLAGSSSLKHVTIMQGTKAYGGHVHRTKLPLVEDAPRDPHPNFYWLHEDLLREMSARHGWAWTIFRPQNVLGGAYGVVMNAVPVIGAYAAICREEGVACGYPGDQVVIGEAVDARLLADACLWATDAITAQNQTFNIANGDLWVLGHQWDSICDVLNTPCGPPQPYDFSKFVAEKSAVWDRVVRTANLRPIALKDLVGESHHLLNMITGHGLPAAPWPPAVVSTVKIRQAGFGACMNTMDSMRYWFRWLERRRILPAATPSR